MAKGSEGTRKYHASNNSNKETKQENAQTRAEKSTRLLKF